MAYKWSCRWQDVPCRHTQTLQILFFSDTARIAIQTAAFSKNREIEIVIELVVTKEMRTAVDRTRLVISKANVPHDSIDFLGTMFKNDFHWINPTKDSFVRVNVCSALSSNGR